MSDSQFDRTRENMQEFDNAAQTCTQLRDALKELIKNASAGKTLPGRLLKQVMEVLKSDPVSDRGERQVAKGDLSLLKGFEFNTMSRLENIFFPVYSVTADRASGKLTLKVLPFIPVKKVTATKAATHVRIVTAVVELDLVNNSKVVTEAQSDYILLGKTEITIPDIENQFTPNTKQALLMVLCIEFYQDVNGKKYILKDEKHNPLNVIHAESAVA
ncbi:hypothetical protein HHL16_23575 [Pseudoflavitalea sp. G-6-1-2]|uniref:hypothetical protein n=1 Tax=Pseudoflavitalea sp. G-6-1-2 TaxID=2728841 RepID=UPI00146F2BA3|nr:hypothetical protein [Pseudoflavitalea sp. G-6-1-2]NML23881.1 hypothetical protein [Pseudoflavitalea sp. G-6-1-2]